MIDRCFFWLALAFYIGACGLTHRRIRDSRAASSLHHVNVLLIVLGFLLQSVGLVLRGQVLQRCPLTNSFEVTMFIVWALVLFYLVIGPSYRVSFLGAFTAPLVTLLLLVGLLVTTDTPHTPALKHSPWIEFHAAIGIMACGAFALAFVVAVMELKQERQLKSHHPGPIFRLLPSVEQLDVIGARLLMLGFALLTAGMIGGAISDKVVGPWPLPKVIWAWLTWLVYAVLLTARTKGNWRGRRAAVATMAAFIFLLTAFWGTSWLAR
ncbi:MAG: cytochrome c biogenesis protein CcsA [Verrucomicrobiota bacterium]